MFLDSLFSDVSVDVQAIRGFENICLSETAVLVADDISIKSRYFGWE